MIGNLRSVIKPVIHFESFSKKQMQLLTWWCPESPYHDYAGIIADGSIRAGKTVAMAVSFIIWAMDTYDGQNFAMCGKTVGSFRRNVWITLAGLYCDEVALMPESFVNQATGRCSVEGAKMWFNCNPDSPMHWFLLRWIEKRDEKRLLHLHFLMDDNPSLSEAVRERYRTTYSGVFYSRFILGEWVMAQGAIYRDAWDDDELLFDDEKLEYLLRNLHIMKRSITIDYGTVNPMVYLDVLDDGTDLWFIREYYWDSRAEQREKDNSQYADDLLEFVRGVELWPSNVVIDPSAASFKIELRNRGLHAKETVETINADNDVIEGIRKVNTLMTRRKIHFYKGLTHTIKELKAYVWDDKALQNSGKEKPIKVADHCPDAVRYYVSTIIRPRRIANV